MTGIVWAGGEIGAFIPSDSSVKEYTTSGTFTPGHARCGLFTGNTNASYADSTLFPTLTGGGWLHFNILWNSLGTPVKLLSLYNVTGQEVFYIALSFGTQTATLQMNYWTSGSSFTAIGSAVTISAESLETIDLNVVFNGASSSAALYVAGTQRASGTGTFGGAEFSRAIWYGQSGGGGSYISECIASGQSTVGATLITAPITGAGLTDNWTGVYTNINEIVYSDAANINSGSANQISNFAHATTISQPVNAVVVTARCNIGGSGPQNLQLDVNVGATDYQSSTIAQSSAFSASVAVWLTNPATGLAWTAAQASGGSLYYGAKSIT